MLENKVIILILILSFETCFQCLSTVPRRKQDRNLQVEISNGVLQGKQILSAVENASYYAFFGIPYAQPPIGDLRFRPPQPVLNWTGILDARAERSKCAQLTEGSENCLFINVYTVCIQKQQASKSLLPVMVWIHGGGFVTGSSDYNLQGPDHLLQHNVVVVALNYRLGVFGFLSTADMALPGNYGLKDQIEALKWVQRNIHHFGGNPSQVTIFGASAGGASVHYLLQTPLANGLFHRAISESGSTLCSWALNREPRKIAFKVAALVGVVTSITEQLVTKLRSVEFEELNRAGNIVEQQTILNVYDDGFPFSPSIEAEHENAVVTKGSYALLSSNQFNKVPLLTGFNSLELRDIEKMMAIVKPYVGKLITKPGGVVHKSMNISSFASKVDVGQTIRSFYFGNYSVATLPNINITNFLSDDMFLRPIHETVKLHSQSVPVYLYRFSYESFEPMSGENKTAKGVSHEEELNYIFYRRNKSKVNGNVSVTSQIVKMWTNFAKTGNPTPISEKLLNNVTWPVAKKKNSFNILGVFNVNQKKNYLSFLDINDRLQPDVNPREKAMQFWDDLYYKYPSVDTY